MLQVKDSIGDQLEAVVDEKQRQRVNPNRQRPAPTDGRHEQISVSPAHPEILLQPLANYTQRLALSNRRIVAVDAQHQTVTFTYRVYPHRSQRKELTSAPWSSFGASACIFCLRN